MPAQFADKLQRMLTALHFAHTIDAIDLVQGWRLHPLKGDLRGYWSLSVTRNHRLVFRFVDGDIHDLDLVDYH